MTEQDKAAEVHHRQSLVAGTAGGLLATAALYPVELIKTRMQVIDHQQQYRSFVQALRSIIQKEGPLSLYHGFTPAMVAASGSWGGYFYFYERSKRRKLSAQLHDTLASSEPEKYSKLGPFDHMLAGIEAGSIMVLLFNPLWVVRTRMALQGAETLKPGQHKYTGMIDALQTIGREEGMAGLYKGVVPALFLTTHGAIQFTVYEWMKSMASSFRHEDDKNKQPAWVSLLLGSTSKVVAATVTYPYQVIKSRMQQREFLEAPKIPKVSLGMNIGQINVSESTRRYNGMLDCILKIYREHGVPGFLRGVIPNAVKVAPSAAITFVVYEETMKVMKSNNWSF